jgi:carbohydrate kinase (thermoresistant glucokinase family)
MGVSGAGKSTLARALAQALGWKFVEGDDLHPQANLAKMAAGIPLTDADRWPFLHAVAFAIAQNRANGVVVSCSALKRSYRDFIREHAAGPITFVLPELTRAQLLERLQQRTAHFMPVSLLDSQLATFQQPAADEHAIIVDGAHSTHVQVANTLAALIK